MVAIAAHAQSTKLPAPSRTIYKCTGDGKVTFSDSPCLAAEKIDVEPNRGVDSMTGKRRRGADVQRELHGEQVAEALRPLTGMDAKQLDKAGRRMRLEPKARAECDRLDGALPALERQEAAAAAAAATPADLHAVQQRLLSARQRHRSLGC